MTELKSLQDQVGRLIQRAEQAEAQCKRMEVALREIAKIKIVLDAEMNPYCILNGDFISLKEIVNKAKAALEDKP